MKKLITGNIDEQLTHESETLEDSTVLIIRWPSKRRV